VIRLTLRQFRSQSVVALGLLAGVAVLLAVTGPHFADLYDTYLRALAACPTNGGLCTPSLDLGKLYPILELFGTVLVAVPGLVGAFWGAPLVTRELETGTHQLAWTQGVTRTRWLAVKLAVVGLASVAVTGLLSLMVTWWSSPMDRARMDRFGAGMFGERNIAPLGYAAFAFMLGVVFGVLIRRTLPAMAATLAAFLAVRLAFTYAVRPRLLSPVRRSLALGSGSMGYGSTNGGPPTLLPNPPDLPNAWIYSTRIVDDGGHGLTSAAVSTACPTLPTTGAPPGAGQSVQVHVPASRGGAISDCVQKLGRAYHEALTYQPANRYWTFQWLETAIFFGAALVMAGFCFWWIRRRIT
jgi:ABC-2 family transporter protein